MAELSPRLIGIHSISAGENYVEKDEQPNKTNGTRFNNFESRSYDMSSLEQQLLNIN